MDGMVASMKESAARALTGLASTALLGCAASLAPPPQTTETACASQQCKLSVKVGADCAMTVEPEHLFVPAGGEAHVLWMIDPPNAPFVFDANGITFKPGQNPGQFDQKEPRGNGKIFHWRDKNNLAGTYKYDIKVRDSQGRLCELDPFIHNR